MQVICEFSLGNFGFVWNLKFAKKENIQNKKNKNKKREEEHIFLKFHKNLLF